uniref:40S ribosomal protein S27-like n=1 Tax=Peromyscus maniculatus bairdii TaxID=230844 RepID=A0A8C8W3E6_PERMB
VPLARDLLHPSLEEEKKKRTKKPLVQSPDSYFMDVKCPGCYKIATVFSHAQTVVLCIGCSTVCASPQEEKPGSQKAVHLEESNTNHLYKVLSLCFSQKALSCSMTLPRQCKLCLIL